MCKIFSSFIIYSFADLEMCVYIYILSMFVCVFTISCIL